MDNPNDLHPQDHDAPADAAQAGAGKFIDSHERVTEEAGVPDAAAERPSRKAAWLAMGAVALALGLIWIAPGVNDSHRGQTEAGSPAQAIPEEGDADDA